MDTLLTIIEFLGLVGTIFSVVWVILVVYWTIRGLLPVLYRLGHGLWRRQIGIVAEGDHYRNLEELLKKSKLFNNKNIYAVRGLGELESLSKVELALINWPDCAEYIQEILNAIPVNAALIVYAPPSGGRIPDEVMQSLELRRNVIVNNFRGRLMNDIVTSMITTAYEKR
ncbi:hypothetical protein DDZ14_02650 [Maritimibacter sp. 55A14]|uniref:hypothetical protein n=1 Tax=Maritimibacter sp. 55A14 TaxID=2174844 RepID=UPI000D62254E|nr:hypothetical protein [Maritimibacter sp. 55A14]PWE34078.1 hypothetical protein DDZ14_02650 [Maritimibacter sp. 55A14]